LELDEKFKKVSHSSAEKHERITAGLAKVAVQCSAETFVVNQSLVLHINPPRRIVKAATFACTQTVSGNIIKLYLLNYNFLNYHKIYLICNLINHKIKISNEI